MLICTNNKKECFPLFSLRVGHTVGCDRGRGPAPGQSGLQRYRHWGYGPPETALVSRYPGPLPEPASTRPLQFRHGREGRQKGRG